MLSPLNLNLCFVISCLQWGLLSSIKKIKRLRSKAMLNIYIKITVEKDSGSQIFDF